MCFIDIRETQSLVKCQTIQVVCWSLLVVQYTSSNQKNKHHKSNTREKSLSFSELFVTQSKLVQRPKLFVHHELACDELLTFRYCAVDKLRLFCSQSGTLLG